MSGRTSDQDISRHKYSDSGDHSSGSCHNVCHRELRRMELSMACCKAVSGGGYSPTHSPTPLSTRRTWVTALLRAFSVLTADFTGLITRRAGGGLMTRLSTAVLSTAVRACAERSPTNCSAQGAVILSMLGF